MVLPAHPSSFFSAVVIGSTTSILCRILTLYFNWKVVGPLAGGHRNHLHNGCKTKLVVDATTKNNNIYLVGKNKLHFFLNKESFWEKSNVCILKSRSCPFLGGFQVITFAGRRIGRNLAMFPREDLSDSFRKGTCRRQYFRRRFEHEFPFSRST